MMEVVYDEKNREAMCKERVRYELPKNIRQIGNAPGKQKIYIEDYVMTYLRKIASPTNTNCRGAILLGKMYGDEKSKVIFVSGAVEAQNLEFDISMIQFGDLVWSKIYMDINKYFDDLIIVGWFLSRMGFTADINEQMKALHKENFKGDGKILFLMDLLEGDEAFYFYNHGELNRENGYYIYYERNEKMQNYIISRNNVTDEHEEDKIVAKDKVVVENIRRKNPTPHKKSRTAFACACVCALAFGTVWCISPETIDNIYGRIKILGSNDTTQKFVCNNPAGVLEDKPDYDNSAFSQDDLSAFSQTKNGTLSPQETDTADEKKPGTNNSRQEATEQVAAYNEKTEQEDNTEYAVKLPLEYAVEAGDTLVSISIRMYGTQDYAKEIADANSLDVEDPIYEGQKIIIPYINY